MVPHHGELEVPGALQAVPRAVLGAGGCPGGVHRGYRHLPRLRIGRINPVIGADGRHSPWEAATAGSLDSSSKALTVDGDIAHILAGGRVGDRDDVPRPETHLRRAGKLLVSAEPHLGRGHLVQRGARRIIDKHLPGVLQDIKGGARRGHRTVKHPRRIIQPAHGILGLLTTQTPPSLNSTSVVLNPG